MLFAVVTVLVLLIVPGASAFSIDSFTVTARNADGTVADLAGTHPFALKFRASVNESADAEPDDAFHEVEVSLPPGLIGTPLNVPRCLRSVWPLCPGSTQIGILRGIAAGSGEFKGPVYNLVPSKGAAAAFGVPMAEGVNMIQQLLLRGSGESSAIQLSGTAEGIRITEVEEEMWGVPADPAHDPERICRTAEGDAVEGCPAGAEPLPLLTLPTACSTPLASTVTTTSFGLPSETAVATALSEDAGGNPHPLVGCERVPFEPRLLVQSEPTVQTPSSLAIDIRVPQYGGAGVTAAASLGRLEIALPDGFVLNPAAGAWLSGCPPDAIGLESAPGARPPVFDEDPSRCPPTSRLGSVRVWTPLVDHPLDGNIYLAAADDNPFAAPFAIYLAVEDEDTGTVLKIPVRLDADASDGRLTATIPELPQFQFGELELEFSGGSRAPLTSPSECGEYPTEATFTPSTAPFAPPVVKRAGITLDRGSGGTSCPPAEADRNPRPSLAVGTGNSVAGATSPLVVQLSRSDSDQHLGSFDLTMPSGLVANLGRVPLGAPVGSALVEAGVGPEPLALDGTVYLDGPYRGSPYSLRVVVPGRAGPLNLGTIVERIAVDFDPAAAQISVHADPLPQIITGVQLQLRRLRVDLDRPGFVRNPTSCEPMSISGSATTSLGQSTPLSDRFQVGGCAALPFRPRLSLGLLGSLGRGGHPGVRAVYHGDPAGAGLAGMAFALPPGELLDLRRLGKLCSRGVAAELCPRSSRLGSLRIETPMLDEALVGDVYMRVPSRRLPDLSAEVRSGGLRFLLRGRTTDRGGRLGVSLVSLPDVPLSRAVLTLPGGRRGIVVNSESLCAGRRYAVARFSAHSGKQRRLRVPVRLGAGC
jgi:hypothetical protein